MSKPTSNKILSLLLVAAMVLTMMPLTAFAEGEIPLGDSGDIIIAAFDELDEYTLYQGYDAGTVTLADLDLPETLTGTDAEGEAVTIDGVTWDSSPDFAPAVEIPSPGYIFTPTLPEGYALAEGVTAPVITVFIRPEGGVGIQPTAATGSMTIGGTSVSDLTQNATGTGWTWTASSATLELNNGYASTNAIFINCANNDTINLVCNGNVTISVADTAVNSRGALNISGSGTLTLENTTANNFALQVSNGDLNITGGTLVATGPMGIYSNGGDITISGSANVTAVSTGGIIFPDMGAGICTHIGYNIYITGGTVNATGKGTGASDGALLADNITISGGTVTLSADKTDNYAIADGGTLTITGGSVNTVSGQPKNGSSADIYLATLTLNGVNAVTAVSAISAPSGYGVDGVKTDANGKLYFWLPAGTDTAISLTAGSSVYTGTVSPASGNGAMATLTAAGGGTGPYTVNIGTNVGGSAYGNSNDNGVTADNTYPNGNTLNINNGGIVDFATGTNIYGSGPRSATGNTVNVNSGGTVIHLATGAYVYSSDDSATASGNFANLAAGGTVGVSVIGGEAQADGTGAAVANANAVTIDGNVGSGGSIYGGYAIGVWGGAATSSGNAVAINNNATVNSDQVIGGFASSDSLATATASNNSVIINGGTVNANVTGGVAYSDGASATNNTVTIQGGTFDTSVILKGGDLNALYSGGDAVTGNRLNLYAADLRVAGVKNFQYIDFYLPQGIIGNETMLTSTAAADLTGVTIDLKFATTAPALAVGDAIRLIDGVSGTFTNKNVTVSGYTFALSVSSGDLVATVTALPDVCEISGTGYPSLTAALAAVGNNQTVTIKLLANINHTGNVVIGGGKQITFNLNGNTLDITVASGTALIVKADTMVDITGAGAFNVTSQDGTGVYANGTGTKATVTNATGTGLTSCGADVFYGEITVKGNATASGQDSKGVFATFGGIITVFGNATASGLYSAGAYADYSTITVKGNATASGTDSVGAIAQIGGKITVDGTVSGESYIAFVDFGSQGTLIPKTQTQYESTTTKAGYYTYTHTDSVPANGTSTVWVKMPASPPPATYLVTVNSGTGGGNYAQGATVTITANAAPSGQVFDQWTTASSGVTFANANSVSTSFTMPANAVTVTATYKSDVGGGGGGGGGTPTQTTPASDGAVQVEYSQSGGAVTLSLPENKLNEIISESKNTATIDLSGAKNVTSAALPKAALDKLAGAGLDVALKLPQGTLTFDEAAAASLASQATGANVSVQLNQTAAASLTSAQQGAIKEGDLVFNISASSGSQNITEFNGTLTVSVPYSGPLPAGVWYLNSEGELEQMDCVYDAATGTVSFTLTHLSLYVVGQDKSAPAATAWVNPFADVSESDWFYDSVKYAHQNGLFSGTTATTFRPGAPMTRGMFVTVLWRLDGQAVVEGMYADFADVAQGSWYENAVGWAAKNGIVGGVGEGFFAPNAPVTREQMAVMLYNYMEYKGYAIPAGTAAAFADEESVSPWALDAVRAIQASGIVSGRPGNNYDPQSTATRAEVATIFARLADNSF